MMPTKPGIIATILVVFFATACQKQDTFPVEPVLTFKSLVAFGDSYIKVLKHLPNAGAPVPLIFSSATALSKTGICSSKANLS
jgi:hypothetical protein